MGKIEKYYTRKELIERGWTKNKMKFFLLVNGYREYWPESLIFKKEQSEDYMANRNKV